MCAFRLTLCAFHFLYGLFGLLFGLFSLLYGLFSLLYGLFSLLYGLFSLLYGLFSLLYVCQTLIFFLFRDNPCPHLGNIVTIKLSENQENVPQTDNTYLTMIVETHFQVIPPVISFSFN